MKKIILSGTTIFSLLCPTLIIFLNQPAIACPVREPETLLSLYRDSDGVYRARFTGQDESEPKPEKDDGQYSIAEVSRHFDVLTTHKGKNAEKVTVYDDHYIYNPVPEIALDEAAAEEPEQAEETPAAKNEDENAAEDEPEAEVAEEEVDEPDSRELKSGDEVLLFVQKDKESGRIEVTAYNDGLKKLSREDMAVYEARIKELGPIFAAEKPDPQKITDWLIRCAEDPATRWEGTAELQRSFRFLEYKQARDAEKPKAEGEAETVRFFSYGGNSSYEYAEAMNEYHRQTLTLLVINSDLGYRPVNKKSKFVRGDFELVDLVTKWADGRVAQALLERVRSGGYSNWENSRMMSSVAEILKDGKLEALANGYGRTSWQSDKDRVDPDDMDNAAEDEPTVEAGTEKLEASPDQAANAAKTVETVAETKPEAAAVTSPEPKKAKQPLPTYGQLRKDILEKFLARADKVIVEPQTQPEVKTATPK